MSKQKSKANKSILIEAKSLIDELNIFERYIRSIDINNLTDFVINRVELNIDEVKTIRKEYRNLLNHMTDGLIENDSLISYENFHDRHLDALATASTIVKNYNKDLNNGKINSDEHSNNNNLNKSKSNVKLPLLRIPQFSGSYVDWHSFRDSFLSLIHNNQNLSNTEKMMYLITSLDHSSKKIISNLKPSDESYSIAFDLLKERFDNPKLIIQGHVKGIFDLKALSKDSNLELHSLYDELTKHIRALTNLGVAVEHCNSFIYQIILSKLDTETKTEFIKIEPKKIPSLTQMEDFLKKECQSIEELKGLTKINNSTKPRFTTQDKNILSKQTLLTTNPELSCLVCKGNHSLPQCPKFTDSSVQQRFDMATKLNSCKNCLRHSNNIKCNSIYNCKYCHKRHHSLLHFERNANVETSNAMNVIQAQNLEICQTDINLSNGNAIDTVIEPILACTQKSNQILLSTASIKIKDHQGKWCQARAILDTGSMNSFITDEFSKKLNLKRQPVNTTIQGINSSASKISYSINIQISSIQGNYQTPLSCLIIPKITSNLPLFSFDSKTLNIPKYIVLADEHFNKSAPIDILIGVTKFYELMCIGQMSLGKNNPTLQKTLLGWIVSGNVITEPVKKHINSNINISMSSVSLISNEELNESLVNFWKVENIQIQNQLSLLSKEEKFCEQHFLRNVTRDSSGRFIVSIPFNSKLFQLGQSRHQALERFYTLERKLNKNPKLKQDYSSFIEEYIDLGHMSKIDLTKKDQNNHIVNAMDMKIYSSNLPNYYLPHHAVIKSTSLTTKLRVVFDGSSKSDSGYSINHTQLVGPVVQKDLFSILLKFREYPVALTGDIEKMYRQVLINPNERKFQCILWRNNQNDTINTYELNTVTYGTSAASYLSTKCLQHLAELNKNKFPKASNVLNSNFYVDDLLLSLQSVEEMLQVKADLTGILASAGLPIRKFLSNRKEVLNEQSSSNSFNIIPLGERKNVKVLGVAWDANADVIKFQIKYDFKSNIITKRSILSMVSQIFDPLGFLTPISIRGKILIQQLWKSNLGWDESLPQNLYTEWKSFQSQLSLLNSINIPRCLIPSNFNSIQLHGFSDSSLLAYGACIYLRCENSSNVISTKLLCSKSRVAPLHGVTIPRLELSAAVLLAQLMSKIQSSLSVKIEQVFMWTDSTIVLHCINSVPSKYKIFVSNRIAYIQELTNQKDWYHVRSQDNPADLISRGISIPKFLDSQIWWNGPKYLASNQVEWPKTILKPHEEENEIKSNCLISMYNCSDLCLNNINVPVDQINLQKFDMFCKYSSLNKLQRIIAWILRFYNNLKVSKSQRNSNYLTVKELTNALQILIKICQAESFPNELNSIQTHGFLKIKSNILPLNPFLDEENILRVGGRLRNSEYSFNKKYPILLPKKHELTNLIFQKYHLTLVHCGAQQLLSCMHEEYWPISGKNIAKGIIRKCLKCFKVNPVSYNPLMGNLPLKRIQPETPAFYNTGLDYAGPISIRDRNTRNSKYIKAYLCLFICMTTKAVHLELVSDLTTGNFLLAFKRFIGRRGIPQSISSDNATNFKGAYNYLRELYEFLNKDQTKSDIYNYLSDRKIKWEFIIPRNPHEGGLWESNIKSTKSHLKKILANTCLTYEQFNTVLIQIESILNSRPLSQMSSDPNDYNPLTPGHFIIGKSLITLPDKDVTEIQENRLSKFQRINQITQHFWKRWSMEVVPELQKRTKWFEHLPNIIKIGSLVLMKDDSAPPLSWMLGRVLIIHTGTDGVVLSATIKRKDGSILKRPINKLCVLPI